jgi:hypothetical protein
MIELSKVIEELKIIKNDLRDLPARRLRLIDLLINKYEHLSTSNDMKESRTLLAEQEDREELMAEALNPLGKFKLVEEEDFKNADVNNPDFEKYAGRYGKSVKEWKDKGDK